MLTGDLGGEGLALMDERQLYFYERSDQCAAARDTQSWVKRMQCLAHISFTDRAPF